MVKPRILPTNMTSEFVEWFRSKANQEYLVTLYPTESEGEEACSVVREFLDACNKNPWGWTMVVPKSGEHYNLSIYAELTSDRKYIEEWWYGADTVYPLPKEVNDTVRTWLKVRHPLAKHACDR